MVLELLDAYKCDDKDHLMFMFKHLFIYYSIKESFPLFRLVYSRDPSTQTLITICDHDNDSKLK